MAWNKNNKKIPYLPKDGSEDAHQLIIPLRNYQLRHDTYPDEYKEEPESDDGFLGRDNLMSQLIELLNNTREKRGSYLIAGYRGSGKTSLINRVLSKYKHESDKKYKNKVIFARINLGHDEVLDTRNVLFNITSSLKHGFNIYFRDNKKEYLKIIFFFVFLFLLSYLIYFPPVDKSQKIINRDCHTYIWQSNINKEENCFFNLYPKHTEGSLIDCSGKCENILIDHSSSNSSIFDFLKIKMNDIKFTSVPLYVVLIFLSLGFILTIKNIRGFLLDSIIFCTFTNNRSKYFLIKKIQNLHDNIAYSFEKDIGALSRHSGLGFIHKTHIPEMKEPQIEIELLNILDRCRNVGFDIIFIFDELDKISLTVTESNTGNNNPNQRSTDNFENETINEHGYRRKKRVDSLLASLKTLITVGKARFFFIAGRDILDSYQSEKGSTSSLYESLFNHVFEVPSFLTDDSAQERTRLHSMIEIYVCSRLIDKNTAEKYWLATTLCKEIINTIEIEEKFDIKGGLKELNKKNGAERESEVNILVKSLLQNLSKILNINFEEFENHKLIVSNRDMCTNSLINETEEKNLLSTITLFIRTIFIEYYKHEELKGILSKLSKELNVLDKCNPYSINKLNTYYIYLLQNKEMSKEDIEVVMYTLRQFINYLTVHSWGNCKRLALLFESFTKPIDLPTSIPNTMNWLWDEKADYTLHFGVTERQRISMGSNLYIMFNHHLSRQFTGTDKLVVSSMAALHYCLKFHRSAFSRHHLFRMTEMMSIYSSPELNNIFETTLTQALWPFLRVIRNGMFNFRFFTWIEQEIRYIARVNDLESASYTFSLDAINDIKAHYRKTLENVMNTYKEIVTCSEEKGPGLVAEINIVLGDIYFLERGYDESVIFYQTAVNAHHNLKRDGKYHFECLIRYIEALLKLGGVQEHRQRYDRAAMNYYQAMQLVDDFLNSQGKPSLISKNTATIQDLLTDGDSKWVLLKQPYWAFLYLNIKRGHGDHIKISIPSRLYGKNDPYCEYHFGQLYFYLGRHQEAKIAFSNVINFFNTDRKKYEHYYSSYLIPTACINLAENALVQRMKELQIKESDSWEEQKLKLTKECWSLLESMAEVESFERLENRIGIRRLLKIRFKKDKDYKLTMKEILQLIFYAAKQYENNNLYDYASMAYLKAISLWVVSIDVLPLNYLDDEHRPKISKIIENMDKWLDDASDNALKVMMDSNGQAQQQAREKWHFKDLANYPQTDSSFNDESMGHKKINKLQSPEGRAELNNDIAFWQGSYLGQQLIAMQNWVYTIKRTLLKEAPFPLKSYRIPSYTTRSLILDKWVTGREQLEQARLIRLMIKAKKWGYFHSNAKKIINQIKSDNELISDASLNRDCYYIISAKGIHNFYTALHYSRILIDSNQAIIIPPSAFIIQNVWRLLFRLVEYEKNKCICDDANGNNLTYENCRIVVREKLMDYVSQDLPTSHLDLDYAAAEAIRQLRALSTMGDASSSARFNVLHNKYYLNDDHEDPGFHLDWTLVQMFIPTALMAIKWIESEMKKIKETKA